MRLFRPACRVQAIAVLFMGCAAALLPSQAPAQTQTETGPKPTPVKFVLEWKIDGTAAPLLVALDKGYFRAEGLNVSLVEPVLPETDETSNSAAKRIAAGDAEMGLGDLAALLRARDANPPAPVKAVFVLYNKPGYAVLGRKSRGMEYPSDLEGKKIGTPSRDPASALWKVFMSTNAIDPGKVTTENIGMPVREPMLAAGQIDAVTALSYQSVIDLKDRGVPADDITVMLMGDHGVKLYGDSILVSETFARDNPEAVRAFLRAFYRGLQDTLARPSTAIELVLKRDPALRKELELDRLRMTIRDNIQTPETKDRGYYGDADSQRLNEAIDQLAAAAAFKNKPKAEDVFDASFLPQRRKE